MNDGISQKSIMLKIRYLFGAVPSRRRKKTVKKRLKKTTEAGMSLKTQLEKMSPFYLLLPFQDVYENKGSYTRLSKMFMKIKVVREIGSFCQ